MKDHSKYDKTDRIELNSLNNSKLSNYDNSEECLYDFFRDIGISTINNNNSPNGLVIDKIDISFLDKSDIVKKLICKRIKHDHCRIIR